MSARGAGWRLVRAGALVGALAGATACKKAAEHQPEALPAVKVMSTTEIQRSEDACKTYVERVCACAPKVATLAEPCKLSHALPDAVRIGVEVAASPESKAADIEGAQASVRRTVKHCIEETAKLTTLGCP